MTTGITMPPISPGNPAIRRRRLAAALRQRRECAGLTITRAAAQLEWSAAKISRIENAQVSVLPRDVKLLLGIYGMHDEHEREELLSLARQSRQRAWWHYYGVVVPDRLQPYAALEAEAATLRSYHPELIPALLQTPAYRAAIYDPKPGPDGELAALLSARQQRRADAGTPHLHAVLSEAILRRPAGGAAVMAAQLALLVEASLQPGTTIQILPFAAGAHPAMDSPFTILAFPDPADPDIAWSGNPADALCLSSVADVQHYQDAFTCLLDMACPPDSSRLLIKEASEELIPQTSALTGLDQPRSR